MAAAISVILPTYNRADLLPRAIRSVLAQSLRDWELIVVDDGSTDSSAEVVSSFVRDDSRIRYLRQGNTGPAMARNAGFRACTGPLITYLDSDDEYLPPHLELRVRFMSDHPEIDCIHGGCRVLGDASRHCVPDRRDIGRLIPITECVVGATIVIRETVLRSTSGWRSGYAEDADLIARLDADFRLARVDFPTYVYHRDSPDSRCDAERREMQ